MPDGGFIQWDARTFKEYLYLDGKRWTAQNVWSFAANARADFGLIARQADDGTHGVVRRVYGGDTPLRPDVAMPFDFQLGLVADDEEEYFSLEGFASKGSPAYFVPFLWVEERIGAATASQQYKLWRPHGTLASSDATSLLHPTRFFRNGSEDPTCVTLSGTGNQTATIVSGGDIRIRYLPAFAVKCSNFGRSIADGAVNKMDVALSLEEVFL